MTKLLFHNVIAALIALLFIPSNSFAQRDAREPGLYAIVGNESIPLQYNYGLGMAGGASVLMVDVDLEAIWFDNPTSGVEASGTFVLVLDIDKLGGVISHKRFTFLRNLTPTNMLVIPLRSKEKTRVYNPGVKLNNVYIEDQERLDFEWKQISDNSYMIKVDATEPGEYAFIFRPYQYSSYDFSRIFGFTVPEKKVEYNEDAVVSFSTGDKVSRNVPSMEALRSGAYDKEKWQFIVGYVNKSWICTYGDVSQREDIIGDSDNKFIHGWGYGALYTPSFDWGLGLRTGAMMEIYELKSKRIQQWCHRYVEIGLYVPLHASYRIPFDKDFALNLYGGPGFQWTIDGQFEKIYGTYSGRRPVPVFTDKEKFVYGNGWPKKINWQADCGVNLRYKEFSIGFTYSFGIVDHSIQNSFDGGKSFVTASKSRQDKMQVSISIVF